MITLLVILGFAVAFFFAERAYRSVIDRQAEDNRDLRDRLFLSRGQPPTKTNIPEKYEERQQEKKESQAKKSTSIGPLEKLKSRWTKEDVKAADKGESVH